MGTREREGTYVTVAASQTTFGLGGAGQTGDYLARIVVTGNTGAFTIFDGGDTVAVFPASTPIGSIEFGLISQSGNFNVTTAASTTIIAVGQFRQT